MRVAGIKADEFELGGRIIRAVAGGTWRFVFWDARRAAPRSSSTDRVVQSAMLTGTWLANWPVEVRFDRRGTAPYR